MTNHDEPCNGSATMEAEVNTYSCFRPPAWEGNRLCYLCAHNECLIKKQSLYEAMQIDLPYHFSQNNDTIINYPTPDSLREEAERAGIIYPENSDCVDWGRLLTELTKEEEE